jgi:hypothetical protein
MYKTSDKAKIYVFFRTLFLKVYAFPAIIPLPTLFAQSCSGNLLQNASGDDGGFECGSQSPAADLWQTHQLHGSTDVLGSYNGRFSITQKLFKRYSLSSVEEGKRRS